MSADDDILRDKKHLNTLSLKLFIANFKDCLLGRVNKKYTLSNPKNNKRQKVNYERRQQVNIDSKEYQGQYHRRQKCGKVENFDCRGKSKGLAVNHRSSSNSCSHPRHKQREPNFDGNLSFEIFYVF